MLPLPFVPLPITTPDGPAAFQFFIILIVSLTMTLSIKRGILIPVFTRDKLLAEYTLAEISCNKCL